MRLGKIPRGGESIVFEGRRMTVTEMEGRRIKQIRVEPAEELAPAAMNP
jgi:CBS domain containing-hemolysin-like protein